MPDQPPPSWRRHRRWLLRQAAMWGIGAALLRVFVAPAEVCPPVDAQAVGAAAARAGAWLERTQQRAARFLYAYDKARRGVSANYNETRHAGVVYVLYRIGRNAA